MEERTGAVNTTFFPQGCRRTRKKIGIGDLYQIQRIRFSTFTSLQHQWLCTIAVKFISSWVLRALVVKWPITTAARSKTWTVSVAQTLDRRFESHLRYGCLCDLIICLCCPVCAGKGLAIGWSPVHGDLPTAYKVKKLKRGQGPTRTIQP
jgi:hypothetical protein